MFSAFWSARAWSRFAAASSSSVASIAVVLGVVIISCRDAEPPAAPTEPPRGIWQLSEITGRARVQTGGPGVLCRQGMLELTPKLAPREGPARSQIELEDGRFYFDVLFLSDGYYDTMTNRDGGHESFSGRYGGTLLLRSDGIWSWPERRLTGSVSTRYDPPVEGTWPPRNREEDPEPQFRFRLEGEFDTPTSAAGDWSFLERTSSGGCWSQGAGRGRWRAAWIEPSVDGG